MDGEEFRKRGREMVDYIADYMENIRERKPLSDVKPGYLQELIPTEAPMRPEHWCEIFQDIERVIMPGVTHWLHPDFHAFYPSGFSYPSILAEMLSNAIGCVGFSWMASPVCTELEIAMMDWLAKMCALPEYYLSSSGTGGGVIQGSASESTYMTLLAARNKVIQETKESKPELNEAEIMSRLVCYCSDQGHTSIERAGLLGAVKCHKVQSDQKERMTGQALKQRIDKDKEEGLIPFFVSKISQAVRGKAEDIWLHVDAAYAGAAFICPEYRSYLKGVEYTDSFNFNPHKWMLINFDCSAMWIKNKTYLTDAFKVDHEVMQHAYQNETCDYRHWQIPLGRRFRSLKMWFVFRLYGVSGMQKHIKNHILLAKEFERLVNLDKRFTVTHDVILGLVCFRLKGDNKLNEYYLQKVTDDKRLYLVPSKSKGIYFLRFAVCSAASERKDIHRAWSVLQEIATSVLCGPGFLKKTKENPK